mmetsp:Transcript_33786/g.81905  ORF Transcript_33786/g.81905 Transcript_33786/m.81905 type:complete len:96 (-) Transcript_33786:131-418(-)
MTFYTGTPFATTTTAPTFHGASTTTKRGCDSMDESYEPQGEQRNNKRIKTSPQPGFHGSAFQPQPFQAPIQFTSPSGSNYFNFGSPAQAKKQFRA